MPYDDNLGFKRIAPDDWLQADIPTYPFQISEEDWISLFLKPQLLAEVPQGIVRLFETARGCMICGWFFYPLLQLGSEQLTRIMEAAVVEKCSQLGCQRPNYHQHLQALHGRGYISADEESAWFAGKDLRNHASHPKGQQLSAPGDAYGMLFIHAERINRLFRYV